jgi:signal transduction histidine kinase
MLPRSPTQRQLLGLAITLIAVTGFSIYALLQLAGLRRLGSDIIDRNRRDTLQLLRIQGTMNELGLSLRRMAEQSPNYPLIASKPEFERLRIDLQEALNNEERLAPANRSAEQRRMLNAAFTRFWDQVDNLWMFAREGHDNEARALIRTRLDAERTTLTSVLSNLMGENAAAEEAGYREVESIYGRVERNIWVFLVATLAAILATGLYVIRANRRIFEEMASLSEQRRELAGRVISMQEDLFRTLARELHDDLGQVLTALGMMIVRAERKIPEDSSARADLREVREIANQTLERVRGMTQMLHPALLDDYGLEKGLEWHLDQFRKQTGMQVHYEKMGVVPWIGDKVAIHVYRILQEALNNVARHAGVQEVWVRVRYSPQSVNLEVEDHGSGIAEPARVAGIGLVAMRERAALLHGNLDLRKPDGGGTLLRLTVPLSEAAPA